MKEITLCLFSINTLLAATLYSECLKCKLVMPNILIINCACMPYFLAHQLDKPGARIYALQKKKLYIIRICEEESKLVVRRLVI